MFQMCYFLAALYVENPLQIQILCSPRTSAVPYFTDTVLVVQEVGFLWAITSEITHSLFYSYNFFRYISNILN